MANKFTNFIFTTEGKDTITQVLAAKKVAADAQLSINTVYTFATKLSTSLVYTQISSLGPKQTKPVGTVTPQDNDTVEMRIQLDNADLTTGYNLQGVAIVGQYNGNNFVLGYINSNETTNIPPYDGTQVQTVALDVSFAISDSNIVTINTQTAGMLTVDDYNALVKLLETRVSPLATDSKVVHLKGNESISDVKRFNETIIGSVDGNAGTADYMNVHTISSDINLDSISSNGNYLSTSKTKTTSGKPNGTSEQYTLVVGGNIQLFNDMSTDALYLRNRIDSKTLTPWKKIVEDVDQTLNAKYNYAQLPTVNGSGVALQSDLAAETNSRSVADRDLKTSIALEAQTRSAADIAFGSSLAAEVAARSTADASATAAMTKEQAARSTADASITANLTTETSARSAADTNLQALYSGLNRNINDEISARSAADKLILGSTADLASQITKERDNRVFNDNSLASDIASNATKHDELFGSMADSIAKNSAAINSVNAATMHLSGNETIAGDKTFTGNIKFSGAINAGDMDLSQITVGGRNLLLGTADWSGGSTRWNYRGVQPNGTYRGTVIASTSRAWVSPMYLVQNAGILQVGKTYAFSTYVRNTSDTDTVISYYYDTNIINPSTTVKALPAHTDWTRVSGTFKVIKDPTTTSAGLRWESQNVLTNGEIQFAGYKLEEGNVATDWTPAPEDAPSNDPQLVHKTGNETITGQKNFKGTQSFENLSVSGYTDVFGPLTAKGDFWVNGSWNGESRKLNTVYNTDPQISYNAAAKAVGWGNGTGSTQLIRIKNGWVSIYIAFTTNKPIDYGIATEIGKITNKDFPLPWGTGSAYGTAIDVTTSAFVGTLIIDTSGVLTINMSSGTMPAGEYLTVNAQYAY